LNSTKPRDNRWMVLELLVEAEGGRRRQWQCPCGQSTCAGTCRHECQRCKPERTTIQYVI